MRFFILIFFVLVSLRAGAMDKSKMIGPGSCPLLFTSVSAQEYLIEAKKYELTRESLMRAEQHMLTYIAALVARVQPVPSASTVMSTVVRNYSGALSTRVRGVSHLAAEYERLVAQDLRLPLKTVQDSTRAAADDPAIFRDFAMAEFTLQGAPSIEAYLYNLLLKNELSKIETVALEREGQRMTVPFVAGPRQTEMVRTVLQYSMTRPGESVLEIGYGTPAVSLGVAFYTRARVVAVDPIAPAENAAQVFAKYGVEILRGNFPILEGEANSLQRRGPFSVIYALDVLRKHGGVLRTNLAPRAFVRWMHRLLSDGGTVVILNDFMDQPNFSRQEAIDAGFAIVRWGFMQPLPEDLLKMMPYQGQAYAGNMALYVLRKGEPAAGRGRVIQRRVGSDER